MNDPCDFVQFSYWCNSLISYHFSGMHKKLSVLLNEAKNCCSGKGIKRYIAVITNDHWRVTTKDFLFKGEAACMGPRERHSPGPNLALNGPAVNLPCIVLQGIPGISKKGTPLYKFVLNSGLKVFRHGQSITCSTELIDGRACWAHLRRSSTRRGRTHIVYCTIHVCQL